ncbi:hypothetical protein SY83_10350 [Paenibacillus swuensis]|uniref:DUF4097 domain-containing protein n=1 Tax=Paenibacillus swuensis TaxID=1178515 RepID=A0A172TI15_9BACL|nr:DUF4097 family beta strand repeat-containing protein [Paenibacillus swuensis]ANE46606.1 hypothetical protein SY83_10350 [Paenibacillus swuensis]
MRVRQRRMLLLVSVVILAALGIMDVGFRKEEIFAEYGERFENFGKKAAYEQANRDIAAVAERELTLNGQEVEEISLTAEGGHVEVRQGADQTIRLQYKVTVTGTDQERANRILDEITVEPETASGRVTLAVSAGGKKVNFDRVRMDYVLTLPDTLKLQLNSSDSTVRIEGFRGGGEVNMEGGSLTAVDTQGAFRMSNVLGSVYVADHTGPIELLNDSGHAALEQVKGDIRYEGNHGELTMAGITGKVTGKDQLSDAHFRDLSGPLQFSSEDSELLLEHIRGKANITAVRGVTRLLLDQQEGYALDLMSREGRIQTNLPISTNAGNTGEYWEQLQARLGDGTSDVRIQAESGDIIVQYK